MSTKGTSQEVQAKVQAGLNSYLEALAFLASRGLRFSKFTASPPPELHIPGCVLAHVALTLCPLWTAQSVRLLRVHLNSPGDSSNLGSVITYTDS